MYIVCDNLKYIKLKKCKYQHAAVYSVLIGEIDSQRKMTYHLMKQSLAWSDNKSFCAVYQLNFKFPRVLIDSLSSLADFRLLKSFTYKIDIRTILGQQWLPLFFYTKALSISSTVHLQFLKRECVASEYSS